MRPSTVGNVLFSSIIAVGLGTTAAPAIAATELEMPTWQAQEPGFAEWWRGLADMFAAANPDVVVKIVPVPFAQYLDQMTVRFASSRPPQIVHLPSRNFWQFASQGWLAPIGSELAAVGVPDEWVALQSQMVWDGSPQGLLLMGYGRMLFYNEKMLADAGLSVPSTPEELLAAIEATTKRDAGIFGLGALTTEHPNLFIEAATWVFGQGLDWMADGTYRFTDPEIVAAIEQYRKSVSFSPPGVNSATARQMFVDGKTAFYIDGPWVWATLQQAAPEVRQHLKVTAVPFPKVAGGGSNSLHVPADLDPATRDLVIKFIQLAASPEWQAKYTMMTGSPAGRRNVLTEAQLASAPQLQAINAAASQAVDLFPVVPAGREQYGELSNIVARALMELITTNKPTAEVLAALQSEAERVVPLK